MEEVSLTIKRRRDKKILIDKLILCPYDQLFRDIFILTYYISEFHNINL